LLLHATHTADGRELSAEERDAADAPFLAWIDAPESTAVDLGDAEFCRVRGWIVSASGRPTSVVAKVGERRQLLTVSEDRPDVVRQLSGRYDVIDERCGFEDLIDLRGADDNPARLELEICDGAFTTTVEFAVSHADRPSPPSRADYKTVWDSVSGDPDSAKLAVSGYTDEDEYARMAIKTLELLQTTVGVRPNDVILEIGAGVGRVGPAIAPMCKTWIATDVSENMMRHAADRLRDFDNVETVVLSGYDLAPIPSESVDVVYSTVVFMHLDEWDRFGYVREAMRVLRPGGRIYIDNYNLLSEPGWTFFMETLEGYHPLERPPNVSKSSTPSELRAYLERAGFEDVIVAMQSTDLFISAWGAKPA
jgi:SAM-dependent methyltransferase